MDRHKVAIVIPAVNEERCIKSTVRSVSEYGVPIVVDDGSCDNTVSYAVSEGALIIRHDVNRGYDEALNSGFSYAAINGFDVVVTFDADGQHPEGKIPVFLEALNRGADVVVGRRHIFARFSEYIFSYYTRWRYGIFDPLCGMKAYKIDVYNEQGFFDSCSSIGTELAIFACQSGKKVINLPIIVGEREDDSRFGRAWRVNIKIIKVMFGFMMR
ncbi:glycosyltransferase family 2 protein [Dasania sp. GY-MA-18]|uniref:Glycosyltransferase family 2 protein n=1 Tax=Dasania phycosphaerae TaxID=2950436 RepID=A0A9J6RH76_9GAMM|nr:MULTISPECIES: glycosyltransferase family 2 protein [Dasania]MCR8921375.1 glycosyltransferase family 2 protein [Dasania sp. GY-MA-18]MCZ0863803.1 glycosyltransferase family 2 protein [Dasania phycosphaerae]MCZ0867531.1 glycosyltransferase family 2 protein [Dasania phycosphaerae]